jgi:hypothetical protein
MAAGQMIQKIEEQLLAAEDVLNTKYSAELAEPNYKNALGLIRSAAEDQEEIETLLIDLYANGRISSEPLAYLMHVLKWGRVRVWLENELERDESAIATGASHQKVLDAYSDQWENREFYSF